MSLRAGAVAADWGVAEDPQRGAVARGARQEGPYVPVTAWKTAPPFISRIIVNLANRRDNN
ncbi:MAG: hypothetical protein LBB47_05865 [Spirochaetaceae bacterium]|nr:hypothetical protein [Spirochaetaceae bacterium]